MYIESRGSFCHCQLFCGANSGLSFTGLFLLRIFILFALLWLTGHSLLYLFIFLAFFPSLLTLPSWAHLYTCNCALSFISGGLRALRFTCWVLDVCTFSIKRRSALCHACVSPFCQFVQQGDWSFALFFLCSAVHAYNSFRADSTKSLICLWHSHLSFLLGEHWVPVPVRS